MDGDPRPQHLAGIVIDAASQVEQNVTLCAWSKGVAMHSNALAGSQFCKYCRVIQEHAVVARLRHFPAVRKARTISWLGFLWIAGFQRNMVTAHRHEQYVAKITVSRAREMRVREAKDGGVFVAVSRSPLVALLEWPNLCVG